VKAAVYLRVSTAAQTEKNQEPECLALAAARGFEPLVVRDVESGSRRRPGWSEVLELARTGRVGAVIVWALDRAGRDRVQLAQDLRDLYRWRVRVLSVREPWTDQDGPMRALLVEIVAWFAESERARLIERTRAGLATARAAGRRLGRPSIMDRREGRVDAATIAGAIARVRAGEPLASVARAVGMARTTLRAKARVSENG
jgi:DNA invertase Pin-like site-specific DNA recombinase